VFDGTTYLVHGVARVIGELSICDPAFISA
jgi:hypothetical protein